MDGPIRRSLLLALKCKEHIKTKKRREKTTPVLLILMKFETATQIYVQDSYIEFYENPSKGSRVVTCGQTDSYEVNRRFLKMFVVNTPRTVFHPTGCGL
jgi:hypothetical protein